MEEATVKKLRQYRNYFLFAYGILMIIGGFLATYFALRQATPPITEDKL